MNAKILVCCHSKPTFPVWQNEVYMPIQVGKVLSSEQLDMQGDDTGDNISHKNNTYCELTGLYWAWKNLRNADYIGLCQYRRYFDFRRHWLKRFIYYIGSKEFTQLRCPKIPDLDKIFAKFDVIVMKQILALSVKDWHAIELDTQDYKTLRSTIEDISPSYLTAYDKVTLSNERNAYNLMIARREWADGYCKWLFCILAEHEKRLDISKYDAYHTRVFGMMSETLLSVYIEHHGAKRKIMPMLTIRDDVHPPRWLPYRLYLLKMKFCYYLLYTRKNKK